jgi:hypothetical protein
LAPKESDSIDTMLLADIKAIFDDKKTDRLWSEQACEALSAMEGRPWAELGSAGKPISKNQLAKRLDRFHIKPDSVRIGSETKKGYFRHQFEAAWNRYLVPHDTRGVYETEQRNAADEMGTSCAFQDGTGNTDVPLQKCEKHPSNGHCSGVPFPESVAAGDEGGRRCDYCGQDGETLQVYYDEASAWLHRECRDPWATAYDDLDIRNQPFYRPKERCHFARIDNEAV